MITNPASIAPSDNKVSIIAPTLTPTIPHNPVLVLGLPDNRDCMVWSVN